MTNTKEHAMLFNSAMVRAILREEDPKTQTRRVVSRYNSLVDGAGASKALWATLDFSKAWIDKGPSPAGNPGPYLKVPGADGAVHRVYPRCQAGDRIWGRETTHSYYVPSILTGEATTIVGGRYTADGAPVIEAQGFDLVWWYSRKSCPAIHMPRAASRITLDVQATTPERLQDISEADCVAEGCPGGHCSIPGYPYASTPLEHYHWLWNSINSPGSWEANPWVWAVSFRRIK